jgi:hypothetical protein
MSARPTSALFAVLRCGRNLTANGSRSVFNRDTLRMKRLVSKTRLASRGSDRPETCDDANDNITGMPAEHGIEGGFALFPFISKSL